MFTFVDSILRGAVVDMPSFLSWIAADACHGPLVRADHWNDTICVQQEAQFATSYFAAGLQWSCKIDEYVPFVVRNLCFTLVRVAACSAIRSPRLTHSIFFLLKSLTCSAIVSFFQSRLSVSPIVKLRFFLVLLPVGRTKDSQTTFRNLQILLKSLRLYDV
jgi:hypothetical protein